MRGLRTVAAICPPGTKRGVRISGRDAPLPRSDKPLHWEPSLGYRVP